MKDFTLCQQIENGPELTEKAHESRSDKYSFIKSSDIRDKLVNQGFDFLGTSAARTRNKEKHGFQKHIMAFTRNDLKVDDGNQLQLLMTNSHDGSTSLQFNIGIFRLVCANGLVAGDDLFSERFRHSGNIADNLESVIENVTYMLPKIQELVARMKDTRVNKYDLEEFKQFAAMLRIKDFSSVDLNTVDYIRRVEDRHDDLYTTFNRIQESVIRGGIKYQKEGETKILDMFENVYYEQQTKNNTTKKITSVVETKRLNQELFNYAEKLAA